MLSTHDLAILLMFVCSGLFASNLVFVALWIRARERALHARFEGDKKSDAPAADLTHLVNAIDSIAVEVERISEAQRFTTKVLVDREQSPSPAKRLPLPGSERVITPH